LNPEFSYFRFNTDSYFPESGSVKHFQALEMRAIDFLQKIFGDAAAKFTPENN
jgi:hypothetical protein